MREEADPIYSDVNFLQKQTDLLIESNPCKPIHASIPKINLSPATPLTTTPIIKASSSALSCAANNLNLPNRPSHASSRQSVSFSENTFKSAPQRDSFERNNSLPTVKLYNEEHESTLSMPSMSSDQELEYLKAATEANLKSDSRGKFFLFFRLVSISKFLQIFTNILDYDLNKVVKYI